MARRRTRLISVLLPGLRALLIFVLLTLIMLLVAEAGTLTSLIRMPDFFTIHAFPVLVVDVLVAGALSFILWRLQLASDKPSLSVAAYNRLAMLKRVRRMWITGVLEHMRYRGIRLPLGLKEQPEAVELPTGGPEPPISPPPLALPAGTGILQVFEAAEGTVLILGEAGFGKTTLLLELAHDSLIRAEGDERYPLPVIFSLASWTNNYQKLTDWLVEELSNPSSYDVPRKVAQAWVEGDYLLPLLDGLDEVAQERRAACVEAINVYRQDHSLLPLVVCCRQAEYQALKGKLHLRGAVEVLPLTPADREQYLVTAGAALEGLRAALQADPVLDMLAQTPLLLNILSQAFDGSSVEDLLAEIGSVTEQRVWERYVENMLKRRSTQLGYTDEQAKYWLAWLAQRMTQHNQKIFYLEQMQPDWLAKQYQTLYRWSAGLVVGGAFELVFWPLGWLFIKQFIGPALELIKALPIPPGIRLPDGSGLFIQLSNLLSSLGSCLVIGLVGGLLIGCEFVRGDGLKSRTRAELETGSPKGVMRIKLVEGIAWSWTNPFPPGTDLGTFMIGLVIGLVTWLLDGLVRGLEVALIFWVFYGLMVVLIRVMSSVDSKQLDDSYLLSPNEGIKRSAKSGVAAGLLFGLLSGLFWGLFAVAIAGLFPGLKNGPIAWLEGGLAAGLEGGLFFGLLMGLMNGLDYGLGPIVQHFTLRFWLWRMGVMPLRKYVFFLDDAAGRLLLLKVGGGYRFFHPLLQEHFVSAAEAAPAAAQLGVTRP